MRKLPPLLPNASNVLLLARSEDRDALCDALRRARFAVDEARSAAAAEVLARRGRYAALVFDTSMLEPAGGTAFIRSLRSRGVSTPLLLIGNGRTSGERVVGLDAGADDYLSAPVHVEELLARLRVLVRRAAVLATVRLMRGEVRIDEQGRRAYIDGHAVDLTGRELAVLAVLATRPGGWVTRAELLSTVWGAGAAVGDGVVADYIMRLRRKLGRGVIESRRALGYRLNAANSAALDSSP